MEIHIEVVKCICLITLADSDQWQQEGTLETVTKPALSDLSLRVWVAQELLKHFKRDGSRMHLHQIVIYQKKYIPVFNLPAD